jgi:hypothetical protein
MTGIALHLAARAADAAHEAAVIGGARLTLATRHAVRTVRREAGVVWWAWLVMRPRPTPAVTERG